MVKRGLVLRERMGVKRGVGEERGGLRRCGDESGCGARKD